MNDCCAPDLGLSVVIPDPRVDQWVLFRASLRNEKVIVIKRECVLCYRYLTSFSLLSPLPLQLACVLFQVTDSNLDAEYVRLAGAGATGQG